MLAEDDGATGMLDAPLLRRWADTALEAFTRARGEIDALNVYPVPDGDTGTNLLLTWESAVEEVVRVAGSDSGPTAHALARGALLGARGNSGVILSQMMRGVAAELASPVDGVGLARALRRAATAGYEAVAHPVEGTMLTVMRSAADAAESAAVPRLADVVRSAARAAREALGHTPDQLEVLRRAGVVDAGGRGVVVLLDALLGAVTGEPVPTPPASVTAQLHRPADEVALDGPAFEVMHLLEAPDERIAGLRAALDVLGDSLLVVGGDGLWNVHVHTDDVGAALEAALAVGRPYRIRVTHFDQQRRQATVPQRVVIAVAAGEELARVLQSAGAVVVRHASDARPATRDLIQAIADTPAVEVVLLPDDRDTLPVAEAAAAEGRSPGRRVAVLPTGSPLQVIAALAVHDELTSFDEVVVRMTAAARGTRTGAVTTAVRESLTSAGVCHPGDAIGLVEGEVVVIGQDLTAVAIDVAERMLALGGELVSVLPGRDAPPDMVAELGVHLRRSHPEVDLEVLPGGQPHYPLLLGVE